MAHVIVDESDRSVGVVKQVKVALRLRMTDAVEDSLEVVEDVAEVDGVTEPEDNVQEAVWETDNVVLAGGEELPEGKREGVSERENVVKETVAEVVGDSKCDSNEVLENIDVDEEQMVAERLAHRSQYGDADVTERDSDAWCQWGKPTK